MKCCWYLSEKMKKRTFFITSLFFLQMILSCDQNHCFLTMKTVKAFWVADFQFWLILQSIKLISNHYSTHASVIWNVNVLFLWWSCFCNHCISDSHFMLSKYSAFFIWFIIIMISSWLLNSSDLKNYMLNLTTLFKK